MGDTSVAISDDALKLLVAEHGVRGTARLLGMDDRQMETFKRRVTRERWMHDPLMAELREKGQLVASGRPVLPVVPKISPTAALHAELVTLGQKTRLSLARGIAKAGEHIETMDGQKILMDSQNVKAVAQTADLVHGWKDSAPQVKIRLDVLNGQAPEPVIDVESVVREDVSASDDWPSDDLDDY